jgi:hypothetical protein
MQLPRRRRLSAIGLACRALTVPIVAAVAVVAAPPAWADGIATPEPYHWVSPPPDLAAGNQAPTSGSATVSFTDGTSDPASVFTDDGQVTLSLPRGAMAPLAGQTGVRIAIAPVRPQPAAPHGYIADGNAYSITATYVASGQPAAFLMSALLDMRYPLGHRPESLYRIDVPSWIPIDGSVQTLLLTVDARIMQPSTFIAGHPASASAGGTRGLSTVLIPIALLVFAAGLLLLIAGVRFRRKR